MKENSDTIIHLLSFLICQHRQMWKLIWLKERVCCTYPQVLFLRGSFCHACTSFCHACTSFLSFKSSRKSCERLGLLLRASKAIKLFSFAKIWQYYKSHSLNKTRLPITWIWSSLFWLTCSSPVFSVFDYKTVSFFMHVICTFLKRCVWNTIWPM